MLVSVDRVLCAQAVSHVGPCQRRDTKEGLDLGRDRRQHRLEVEGENAEALQRHGADPVQVGVAAVKFGQLPGLLGVDEHVHRVGEFHDAAHRLAALTRLVERGDLVSCVAQLRHQWIRQGCAIDTPVEALGKEAGAAAGDVDVLADQVAVDAGDEVLQLEIDVLKAGVELGGEVVAQPLRVEALLQVAGGGDEGPTRLAHLLAIHGQKAMGEDVGRRAVAGEVQHGRPEQRVKVEDVLADEVVLLGGAVGPRPLGKIQALTYADLLEAGVVADRRIEPDVEVLARRVRDLEAEVGRVARDVPVAQLGFAAFLAHPLPHLVARLRLQPVGVLCPLAQKGLAARVGQLEEMVLRRLAHGRRAAYRRVGVLEFGRAVGGAALLAAVTVLVGRSALGALALHKAVRQEHLFDRVVELLDRTQFDQAGGLEAAIDTLCQFAILVAVGAAEVVEADHEAVEVGLVLVPDAVDQLFGRDAFRLSTQHDRRAVRVVGACVPDFMPAHALKAHPDVGLDVLHQMADVDLAVGVGQRGGDEQSAGHGWGSIERRKRGGRDARGSADVTGTDGSPRPSDAGAPGGDAIGRPGA